MVADSNGKSFRNGFQTMNTYEFHIMKLLIASHPKHYLFPPVDDPTHLSPPAENGKSTRIYPYPGLCSSEVTDVPPAFRTNLNTVHVSVLVKFYQAYRLAL